MKSVCSYIAIMVFYANIGAYWPTLSLDKGLFVGEEGFSIGVVGIVTWRLSGGQTFDKLGVGEQVLASSCSIIYLSSSVSLIQPM